MILHLAWSAKCLFGNTLCVQFDMQEWDMRLNTGKMACPPPLQQANEFVHNNPTAWSISSSVNFVNEQVCLNIEITISRMYNYSKYCMNRFTNIPVKLY